MIADEPSGVAENKLGALCRGGAARLATEARQDAACAPDISGSFPTKWTSLPAIGGFALSAHARVHDHRNQFLGYAYVNPHALICARILSRSPRTSYRSLATGAPPQGGPALRERHYPCPITGWCLAKATACLGWCLIVTVSDHRPDATAGMEAMRAEVEATVLKTLTPRALVWKNDGSARDLSSCPSSSLAPTVQCLKNCRSSRASCKFGCRWRGRKRPLVL